MRGLVAISLLLWLGNLCSAADDRDKVEVSEANFNGNSYVEYDIRKESDNINAKDNTISFEFRTIQPSGLIFHGSSFGGTVSDYITIELVGGKLRYSASFGSYQLIDDSHEVYLGDELADGSFHKLTIERTGTEARLYLDEGKQFSDEAIAVSKYRQLNLDQFLFVGGAQKKLRGVMATTNFNGCLRKFGFTFNGKSMNLLSKSEVAIRHQVDYECPSITYNPVTFTKKASPCSKEISSASSSSGSFMFRTYQKNGKLFAQGSSIEIVFGERSVTMRSTGNPTLTVNFGFDRPAVNTGMWHKVEWSVTSDIGGLVSLTVDGRKDERPGRLASSDFDKQLTLGTDFIGCIVDFKINNLVIDFKQASCVEGVQYGKCNVSDHCNPNPCMNGGECRQEGLTFECTCREDYKGSVCQFSKWFKSCNEIRLDELKRGVNENTPINKNYTIDPDGSGPIKPFLVYCNMTHGRQLQRGMTVIKSLDHHVEVRVADSDEAAKPESFIRDIRYFPDLEFAKAIAMQSEVCQQYIEYSCINSKLLNGGSPFYGRWVSARNKHEKYWGGAKPDSLKCACGMTKSCVDSSKDCNCDAARSTIEKDYGQLTDTQSLPVTQVLLGDVSPLRSSSANVSVGDLYCSGEINNTATFVNEDGYIQLAPWTPPSVGDISFLFRTPYAKGIILHNGDITREYFRVHIANNQTLRLDFNLGHGKTTIDVKLEGSATLNDRKWHKVLLWHNQKEFGLELDGKAVEKPLPLHLSTQLNVAGKLNVGGYSREQLNGFVGCIKGLSINGKVIDLYALAKNKDYVRSDCGAACKNHQCMNNAECVDFYNVYKCNCDNVPFYGYFCHREYGASFTKSDSEIEYTYPTTESMLGTDITIAFTTRSCGGKLLEIKSSDINHYYRLRFRKDTEQLILEYNTGSQDQFVIEPPKGVKFCDNKRHTISIRRSRPIVEGQLFYRVDNDREKLIIQGNLKSFSKPKNIIIGGKADGTLYSGCISGVKVVQYRTTTEKLPVVDPIRLWYVKEGNYPDASPADKAMSKDVTAKAVAVDRCGPESPTPPLPTKRIPDIEDRKEYDDDDEPGVGARTNETDGSQVAVIVVVVLILVLIIIALLVLIYWYWSRHKGTYHTHEDDENLANAEPCIDLQQKGPPPSHEEETKKKKEWYI